MATPFSYSGQYNAYDPFNQRVRGQPATQTLAQPVQAASYSPASSAPTGAYPGLTPSAPVYQGPPAQGGQSQYPPTQPSYSTQGGPSSPTSGWPQAPPQQTPGQYLPQHPGGVTGQAPPYQAPPAPQAPTPAAYAMPGWDQGKWADPQKHDAKYDAGRLMSTLAPSVQNIPHVLGLLQSLGHQVQYQGGDTAIVDGFTVDMVQGSHSDHPAWQWLVPQNAPAPDQGQTGGLDPYTALLMQFMQQPQQGPALQGPPAQTGGVDQTALLQSILTLLQQQQQAPQGPVAPTFSFY